HAHNEELTNSADYYRRGIIIFLPFEESGVNCVAVSGSSLPERSLSDVTGNSLRLVPTGSEPELQRRFLVAQSPAAFRLNNAKFNRWSGDSDAGRSLLQNLGGQGSRRISEPVERQSAGA